MLDCVLLCCHHAHACIDLISACSQLRRLYTLPTSENGGGLESLGLLFWGSRAEKFAIEQLGAYFITLWLPW